MVILVVTFFEAVLLGINQAQDLWELLVIPVGLALIGVAYKLIK